MSSLNIDIETYSSVPLSKAGLYKYAQSPDFEILLFAYSWDYGEVRIVDFACGEELPDAVFYALQDAGVIKRAYNAAFEWYCINVFFNRRSPFVSPLAPWRCTMLHALYCGYPSGLMAVGEAMGFSPDKKKMYMGNALIRTFCIPCAPTAKNGGITRVYPQQEPEKWGLFKTYCVQDVVSEMAISKRLVNFPVPDAEQELWVIDQYANAYGIGVDMRVVNNAVEISRITNNDLTHEAIKISGLDNPNSRNQLKRWLETEIEEELPDVQKATVTALIPKIDNEKVKRMLEIRLELAKTSVKKYEAMQIAVCQDSRIRGLLQFYGANRTGRWSGRLVQMQNLPQNHIKGLEFARDCVKKGHYSALKLIYGNIPSTLSQLVRTAFIAPKDRVFIIADFSAIEARIIAWLAKEQWRIQIFKTHGKIYEASAASMFGVPIDLIKKGNPEYELRQKGKIAELACGYGGSIGALKAMGADKMGLDDNQLGEIIRRWRASNPRIVDLWYSLENAMIKTVSTGRGAGSHSIIFTREYDTENELDFLAVTLPSRRKLYYVKPFLAENKWGNLSVHYYGADQKTKKWGATDTYGGKITENIIQAIARDCLAISIKRLYDRGYKVVFSVHDEVVVEGTEDDLDPVCNILGEPIPWAPDLFLKASGFVSEYYVKD